MTSALVSETANKNLLRIALVLALTAGLLGFATPAQALHEGNYEFTVNTTTDAVDANLGDHICDSNTSLDGNQCTLRAALMEAYEHSGDETINLPYATYPISIPTEGPSGCGADGFDLTKGDFDLGKKITINTSVQPNDVTINGVEGPGGALPVIDANGIDRVFQIAGSTDYVSNLNIDDVEMREGNHPSEGSCYSDMGGAIWVDDWGHLQADNVTVTENGELANDLGGALAVSSGSAIITDSWFTNNKSSAGGGAIYTHNGGLIRLTGSTLENNQSNRGGGAIGNYGEFDIEVTDSNIENNSCNSCYGGGIHISSSGTGTMAIEDSVISGNISTRGGGGVYWSSEDRDLTISDTTISSNKASYGGAGLYLGRGPSGGSVTVERSTISGNIAGISSGQAYDDPGADGGGIWTEAPLTMINSTVSGNSSTEHGGGLYQGGTEAQFNGRAFTLKSTTVAGNSSDVDANGSGNVGNLYVLRSDSTLTNSIVAIPQRGENCAGAVTLVGYNLVQSPPGCQLNGDNTSPYLVTDNPDLQPLDDNGGATETHALDPTSPAIDAGNPDEPTGTGTTCPTTDQRGFGRPFDGDNDGTPRCDLGSFEYHDFDRDNYEKGQDDNDSDPCDPDATGADCDPDEDDVPNKNDDCDGAPEDKDGFQDTDGCPDPDNDGDGVFDAQDPAPNNSCNPDNTRPECDIDGDLEYNSTDLDDDGDGQTDAAESACGSNPHLTSSKSADLDNDGVPNCVDSDRDGDTVNNEQDEFPDDGNESVDTDKDSIGNNTDTDDDGDGVVDNAEQCDLVKEDDDDVQDADGCPETDADNDGRLDEADAFPEDDTETDDVDDDGIGDNADTDDDNDTVADAADKCQGVKEDVDGTQDTDGCIDKVAKTEVTIAYKAKTDVVKGDVTSTQAGCVPGRKVTLFKVKKGDDAKIGEPDTTKDDGLYSLPAKGMSGKAYVEVAQPTRSLQPNNKGIVWTCSPVKSETIPFG